jgi:hypothetical protein
MTASPAVEGESEDVSVAVTQDRRRSAGIDALGAVQG